MIPSIYIRDEMKWMKTDMQLSYSVVTHLATFAFLIDELNVGLVVR